MPNFVIGRSFDEIISVIEGVRTVLLTFFSLFYTPLTVDDVMSVVNDTLANTCFEAYPVMIFNDTRMVSVPYWARYCDHSGSSAHSWLVYLDYQR